VIRALVLGGATGVWEELEQARALFEPDMVVAVNHAGRDYAGRLDHWATYHADLLPGWIAQRAEAGREAAGHYWTAIYKGQKPRVPKLPFQFAEVTGGSSGLLGTMCARIAGADRIVLCGIPMDPEREHFHKPGAWAEALKYRKAWQDALGEIQHSVRSMSGWTAQLLGNPSEDWLR
jgi:hypothetical protein